jgi:hypothetical protein
VKNPWFLGEANIQTFSNDMGVRIINAFSG